MENTYESLQQQIDKQLYLLNQPKNIHINHHLSHLLDQLDIPFNAKLACLSIDTSMKHLDRISYYHYERDAILIGDLLSAHYYQLLADLKDVTLQLQMSQAIVKINELKSHVQHHGTSLSKTELLENILQIETLLVHILIMYYHPDKTFSEARNFLIEHLEIEHLSYLMGWSQAEIRDMIATLQNYIKQ
ncbi:heptaprenyl diphosphate synthase component 1 [Staphylococcus lutrae]|uniref:Heptaprenyl diphosphate synthase n=1 Tax=Staphylococcus lutrae TaxID=155085 RepID=A0AAC9RVT3_9STAP|nr:heptaprenyl diphosphate synthase component 1 [Staphylococcus lutrae]ARJ51882.1 hypothetical protein B5P37_11415 [Staphylococcus lutrae]PNZ35945.1 hypothetical protein CD134_08690 [Staphylococcus lutrae]